MKRFKTTKSLTVEGFELGEGDVTVAKHFEASQSSGNSNYLAASEGDSHVLLDITEDLELQQEGMARELINRVQRGRKKVCPNVLVKFLPHRLHSQIEYIIL